MGKTCRGSVRMLPGGNTPTHMGKTAVHIYTDLIEITETPPRTWGRRIQLPRQLTSGRNTPTHMGKTDFSVLSPSMLWETPPRTWGRRTVLTYRYERGRNTPTHMGKTAGTDGVKYRSGNTPTHMGKTLSLDFRKPQRRKHPHAHGEDRILFQKPPYTEYSGESVPPIPGESVPVIPRYSVPPIPVQSVPPFSGRICC